MTFHFEGALADKHRMNFYESARFQYAAARLLVKLAQFRSGGRFVKNITNASNLNIQLLTQADGSFNVNVEDPGQVASESKFIEVSLADLLAYVSERVIEKIADSPLLTQTTALEGVGSEGGTLSDQRGEAVRLAEIALSDSPLTAALPAELKELVRRRAAESYRERRLDANRSAISRIDFVRGQRLVAMSCSAHKRYGHSAA